MCFYSAGYKSSEVQNKLGKIKQQTLKKRVDNVVLLFLFTNFETTKHHQT